MAGLIGNIVERKPGSLKPHAPSLTSATSQNGFPVAKHRSQSAFAKARQQANASRPQQPPPVASSLPPSSSNGNDLSQTQPAQSDDWRTEMAQHNAATVEQMTDDQRQRAVSEIFDILGDGVGDLLKRAREARERKDTSVSHPIVAPLANLQPHAASPEGSRPQTPTKSALRSTFARSNAKNVSFTNVQPQVHVYESQPSSPRKVLGLLEPRTDVDGDVPVQVARRVVLADESADVALKDDPEAIRQRFFPNEPADNPALEWMKPSDAANSVDARVRFDLHGRPIPPDQVDVLPSHLGLHHHSQGSRAGYTLEDLFLLSRSTVPAQRASILGILAQITRRLLLGELDEHNLGATREQIRASALQSAAASVAESGSVGVRAVDLLYETLVSWDDDLMAIEGVWIHDGPMEESALAPLTLPTLLVHVRLHFSQAVLPEETLGQLLAILHRLSRDSLVTCEAIMATNGLLSATMRHFLPVSPGSSNAQAIAVLRQLAASSREHASALVDSAEMLLRYVAVFDPAQVDATTETLYLYATLARYGLTSSLAGLAAQHLSKLGQTIRTKLGSDAEPAYISLARAFIQALEVWVVCATDPHKTTPDHDLIWSQVVGLEWMKELLMFASVLGVAASAQLHADIWSALAAVLDGSRVNSPRAGEADKEEITVALLSGFQSGAERTVLRNAVEGLNDALQALATNSADTSLARLHSLSRHSRVLLAAVRLAGSAQQTGTTQQSLAEAIQNDGDIAGLLFSIPVHSLWTSSAIWEQPHRHVLLRPVSHLVFALLNLARARQVLSAANIIAATSAALAIVHSGVEEIAIAAIHNLLQGVSADLLEVLGYSNPSSITSLSTIKELEPFFVHELYKSKERSLSTYVTTPQSLPTSTTQIMSSRVSASRFRAADWPLWPLNSLLKSGSSSVFSNLPRDWDASETEITRGTLLLVQVIQRSIIQADLLTADVSTHRLRISRSEVVFGCMRVFMLEHGQEAGGQDQEVFRDTVVDALMRDLLRPFTLGNQSANAAVGDDLGLETVATRYLGPDTPFYQFYSDFVALYDAISFAHPLFGALLIPSLSMRYTSPDYRRLLFCDHAEMLAHIRVAAPNVLSGDAMEFMQPLEDNAEVLGGMLGGLVKATAHDFVRAVCLHHIASQIWPDISGNQENDEKVRARAVALLSAAVTQGDLATIREVATYGGCTTSGLLPLTTQAKTSRQAWLETFPDRRVAERLCGLLME
ncbi:hypothetical protein BKA62DRAFT_695308 [Auriculariales sp. MPI-PUGE-AT-0066]|nr:hypothetical protein BKA62DRAFT_695308 [Auriculariales sp. MPI-PUGE-AT-0066]